MWECSVEIEIGAPVEQVYERLSDLSRHSDFSDGLVSVRETSPGRYRAEEQVPGKYVSEAEITALEPPTRIAWRAWVKHVMRTQWEFRLTPIAGGTRLIQVSRWEAAGPAGFVMLNVHRKRHVPEENRRTLERIKSVLEAEAATTARRSA